VGQDHYGGTGVPGLDHPKLNAVGVD
jgi:hypothetical protein